MLSILIPTISSRREKLEKLLYCLKQQTTDDVFIIIDNRDDISIGQKRNDLIDSVKTEYLVFIDDDDLVSDDYIATIVENIKNYTPDVIGFNTDYYYGNKIYGMIRQSFDFKTNELTNYIKDENEFFILNKSVNHLNPVKSSIAKSIKFPCISYGEDKIYGNMLRLKIKNHIYLDKVLYKYLHDKIDNSINLLKSSYKDV